MKQLNEPFSPAERISPQEQQNALPWGMGEFHHEDRCRLYVYFLRHALLTRC